MAGWSMSDEGWQVSPHPVSGDVAAVIEAADATERRHWRLSDHLDDRSKEALLELAKGVI